MTSSKQFNIDTNGEASWLSETVGPTQSQLQAFLTKHRHKLTELCISVDHENNQPNLDFNTVGQLPCLKTLLLSGVSVDLLSFTTSNTPALESLETCYLSCDHKDGLSFELALPLLKSFKAEYVTVDGKCDLGLSLSSCPLLQIVRTYKFRYLTGDNYMVLPNCEELTLCRSECTDSLELISAPKLTKLSLHSAYDLKNLLFWDLPNKITLHDVEKLVAEITDACKVIAEELNQWADKWKDGTFTGKDAFRMRWIELEEIKAFDFNEDSDYEQMLAESLEKMHEERREMAKARVWQRFVTDIANRPVVHAEEALPRCKVNCTNVTLSRGSRMQLTSNKRLNLVGLPESPKNSDSDSRADSGMDSDSDSDMDDMFW